MNSVLTNNLTLKYQRCTSLDCEDIEIRKFEFVAKTYFPSFEQLYSSISFGLLGSFVLFANYLLLMAIV